MGLYWALGGAGFPFGENDSRGVMMGSFLANIQSDVGGVTIVCIGGIGAIAALATIRMWGGNDSTCSPAHFRMDNVYDSSVGDS
ncbi:hypothetical protein bpmyx0001_16810 [Bacillus pseudomycoides DSM 12442]|nr:hypothetical protein bpmyx0001_16810 [Bacillus pseudomycoides DSM 12442]